MQWQRWKHDHLAAGMNSPRDRLRLTGDAHGLPAWLHSWAHAGTAIGTIVSGIVLLVLFNTFISPWLERHLGGRELLDVIVWRTPHKVDITLEAYGEAGRRFYRTTLVADLLFPIVYSLPFAASVAYAAGQLRRLRRHILVATLIPFAGGIFDWAENVLLWVQTNQFPHQGDLLSWIAWLMTAMKFACLLASVTIIVFGLAADVWTRRSAID